MRIVVPFPAGGPTDILSRVVAQRLSEVWGQPVVIENQPGANTAIAAARVAKMPPDGYTLFAVMDVTMVLNPITNKTLVLRSAQGFCADHARVQEHLAAERAGARTAQRP